jgi:hypothetical protein
MIVRPRSQTLNANPRPQIGWTFASHLDMDEAFCARMRAAIELGLESAPIGVVTTPGTKNPRYVPAEPLPLAASSPAAMEHA